MAAQVVDFLEAVQVDADQRELRALLLRQRDFEVQPLVEARPVRQAGQHVAQCQPAQVLERFGPHVAVDHVAHEPRADDHERRTRDRQRQRTQCVHVGPRAVERQRRDAQRGHPGEMQREDRERQHAGHLVDRVRRRPQREVQRERREGHRQQHRRDQVADVPRHDALDPPREHAGVMHQHDRDADDRAAERGRDPDDAAGRQREADRAAADRDEQRHERERQVELHGRAGFEAEHRDEVRAPDRHAGRNGRQHLPAEPLHAGGVHRALEQARGDPRTGPAQQRGKQDQPVIVPINDAP